MHRTHVAIVDRRTVRHLLWGTKRIETRFSAHRRPPFGKVRPGDTVHFKVSGVEVIGTSIITRVDQFERLTPADLVDLRRRYNHAVQAPASYWRTRRRCAYGLLMWITPLTPPPARIHVPRQYGNGWLVPSGR